MLGAGQSGSLLHGGMGGEPLWERAGRRRDHCNPGSAWGNLSGRGRGVGGWEERGEGRGG